MAIYRLLPCLVLLASAGGPCPAAERPPLTATGGIERLSDETARVTGVVERNERLCELDGICWLVLRAGDQLVDVLYTGDEGGSCPNQAAADAGYAAEPGDRLEVFGRFRQEPKAAQLSTCPDPSYYIRPAG